MNFGPMSAYGAAYFVFVGFFLSIGWAFGSWLIGWVLSKVRV